ncbi:hypothetical protein GGI17_001961 [Coemansia sp. S146]|nr:hypothetical protein GGI17_001961 [Coemansia sp. S146]
MSLSLFDDSDTDSVIADFDFNQQASSSSLVLVNERSLGEQDFYAEFGAVVDDCESPSSNYMYLADDTSSQLTLAQLKGKGKDPMVYDTHSHTYFASASMQSSADSASAHAYRRRAALISGL